MHTSTIYLSGSLRRPQCAPTKMPRRIASVQPHLPTLPSSSVPSLLPTQPRRLSIKSLSAASVNGPAGVPSSIEEEEDANSAHKSTNPFFRVLLAPFAFFSRLLHRLFSFLTSFCASESTLSRLPFGFRQFIYRYHSPPPIDVHVSPQIREALATSRLRFNGKSPVFYSQDGRFLSQPLADLPVWRLEDLVGCAVGRKNLPLYRKALTAPSALREDQAAETYDVLEYLGDSVLSLVVRETLIQRLAAGGADEDMLTRMEQNITNGRSLAQYARRVGIPLYVASNVISMRQGSVADRVFEDALEALLGALFLDRGLDLCRRFVWRMVDESSSMQDLTTNYNFKSKILQWASRRGFPVPIFVMLRAHSSGPISASVDVSCRIAGVEWGRARGQSRREAEQGAAKDALDKLGISFARET